MNLRLYGNDTQVLAAMNGTCFANPDTAPCRLSPPVLFLRCIGQMKCVESIMRQE